MLIVTNRNIVTSNFKNEIGDEGAFGDQVNAKGPNEVRFAHADKVNGKWQVRLVKEPKKLTKANIPSKLEFNQLRDKLVEHGKNCVFFVHGFNQSFKKNLDKSYAMQEKHGVEVIAFSWPSNPGGGGGGVKFAEYRDAKRKAKASVGALDSTLEKLGCYLKAPFNKPTLKDCNVKFSFMAFSLGNFLLQDYIVSGLYGTETRIFDNVILCQADVENLNHDQWTDCIHVGKRLYVTINEDDWVLKWAEFESGKDRLGRTSHNLRSKNATYFDFTDGSNVSDTHGVFYKDTNSEVKEFFTAVLNGRRGEPVEGFRYDTLTNSYRF